MGGDKLECSPHSSLLLQHRLTQFQPVSLSSLFFTTQRLSLDLRDHIVSFSQSELATFHLSLVITPRRSCSLKIVGIHRRQKVASLLSTRSGGLGHLHSLLLFTGSLQVSRECTCTVCYTTTQVLGDLAGMAATAYSQPKSPR
jgi:hypothetical protein